MRRMNPQRWRLFAVAPVVVLALTACSIIGGDKGSTKAANGDEEITFVWADAADADSLHFAGLSDSTTRTKREQIFEALVSWDFDAQDRPILKGELAKDWKATDDLTWVFHIREGISFSNGEALDAAAVKTSWDYYLDPATTAYAEYRRYFNTIESLEVTDPMTLVAHTKVPTPLLPNNLASHPLITAPKHLTDHYTDMKYLNNNPIGTGPFTLNHWKPGIEIEFDANPKYWNGAPEIDHLIIRPMPEVATRLAALMSGDVDFAEPVPPEVASKLKANPDLKVFDYDLRRHPYVGLDNINPGPTRSKAFRQALNYAVDWDTIIKTLFNNTVVRTPVGINPLDPHFDPTTEPYPYDPAKAKELIRAAGYEPGKVKITLNYTPGRQDKDTEFMQAIVEYLGDVGVAVDLKTVEWNTFLERLAAKDLSNGHEMSRADSTFDSIDYMLKLTQKGEANTSFYDADMEAKLIEANKIVDPQERKTRALELQLEWKDLAPMIFGFQAVQSASIDSRYEWPLDGFERYNAELIHVVK